MWRCFSYMFLKCIRHIEYSVSLRRFMEKLQSINRYLRHLLLPGVIGAIIFLATCVLGSEQVPDLPPLLPWDKMVHAGMFFVLSAVCYYDYYRLFDGNVHLKKWIFWCFFIPVIYGGSIELLQLFVFTSRSAEWCDFVADIIGSLLATVGAIYYLKYRDKPKKNLSL
jgi:VanZ family protein